jgi:hypothetical protein
LGQCGAQTLYSSLFYCKSGAIIVEMTISSHYMTNVDLHPSHPVQNQSKTVDSNLHYTETGHNKSAWKRLMCS